MTTVIFEAPEASLATMDEIAANLDADRQTVILEALTVYLSDYADLKAVSKSLNAS